MAKNEGPRSLEDAAKLYARSKQRSGGVRQERGGARPPQGYGQIFSGGAWQPAVINLRGQALPVPGHEALRFPNTEEGKRSLYAWERRHKAGG